MRATFIKNQRRTRRTLSVRAKLRRTASLPRLSVSRSIKHIAAQIVDDASGRTLAHATSTSKVLADQLKGKKKTERAAVIGPAAATGRKDRAAADRRFDIG